jgi:hypothetical protein
VRSYSRFWKDEKPGNQETPTWNRTPHHYGAYDMHEWNGNDQAGCVDPRFFSGMTPTAQYGEAELNSAAVVWILEFFHRSLREVSQVGHQKGLSRFRPNMPVHSKLHLVSHWLAEATTSTIGT